METLALQIGAVVLLSFVVGALSSLLVQWLVRRISKE